MADTKYETCVAVDCFTRGFDDMSGRLPLLDLASVTDETDLVAYDQMNRRYVGTRLHQITHQGQQALFEIAFTRGQIVRVTASQQIWTRRGMSEAQQLEPGVDKGYVLIPGKPEPLMSTVIRVTPVGPAKVVRVTAKTEPYLAFVNDVLMSVR